MAILSLTLGLELVLGFGFSSIQGAYSSAWWARDAFILLGYVQCCTLVAGSVQQGIGWRWSCKAVWAFELVEYWASDASFFSQILITIIPFVWCLYRCKKKANGPYSFFVFSGIPTLALYHSCCWLRLRSLVFQAPMSTKRPPSVVPNGKTSKKTTQNWQNRPPTQSIQTLHPS